MLDKNFWGKIALAQGDNDKSRRIIINHSNSALHLAKQAIFAMHRDNLKEAKEKIVESENILLRLQKDFAKKQSLMKEGAWSAAREEYAEAKLFYAYVDGKRVGEIKEVKVLPEEYLGGLSDFTGELLRRAVLLSTKQKFESVEQIAEEVASVIHFLLSQNLSGVLRTKFDQAKKNQNKIEQIMYEISLRHK